MILQTAKKIAGKYNQSVRKNNHKGFTLESNNNPNIDYHKFSGYEFKKMYQDDFEGICQTQEREWESFECLDCEYDWQQLGIVNEHCHHDI